MKGAGGAGCVEEAELRIGEGEVGEAGDGAVGIVEHVVDFGAELQSPRTGTERAGFCEPEILRESPIKTDEAVEAVNVAAAGAVIAEERLGELCLRGDGCGVAEFEAGAAGGAIGAGVVCAAGGGDAVDVDVGDGGDAGGARRDR